VLVPFAASGSPDKRKELLTTGVSGSPWRGDWIRTGDLLNPIQGPTHHNQLSQQADTSSTSSSCTNGCTIEQRPEQTDPLAALAAALLGLSPADRSQLAAILLGQQPDEMAGKNTQ
jgi:hypothetical protein